ncbi:hypothetical protein [Paludibacterium paludis]|uniref:Lipoprotein n=1 Tax=Paludibacterium paludis TaxID=1225769 RepID=A0A918U8M0_9NEIS|nr:hypothetical protein [Paludibacterium paludis]GGY09553.1 hypothetical protein GCM10011289_10460 [Paludibacterium paludis]
MFRRMILRTMAAAAVLVLAACSTTRVVHEWTPSGATGHAMMKQVLVMGISKEEGPRRAFEDTFSAALARAGVKAVPMYSVHPELGEADQDKLKKIIADSGVDGILVTRVVRVDSREQVRSNPWPAPYMGFYGYYHDVWVNYDTVSTYKVAVMETNLWSGKDGKLLWSGTTESTDPEDVKRIINDFSSVVTETLAKQGLIPPLPKS